MYVARTAQLKHLGVYIQMDRVQFGEADDDDVDVPLNEDVRDALVSEDAKRLESLVGPNAEKRETEPFPRDKWFAADFSNPNAKSDEYCYLCTIDPYDNDEDMRNEFRDTMKKWVAVAELYDIKSVCQAIKAIYDEHIHPLTNRTYTLQMIREHIYIHDRINPLLLLRQNIQRTQFLSDYWAGRLVYKPMPELGESGTSGLEINEAAERHVRFYQKQLADYVKLYSQLESRRK